MNAPEIEAVAPVQADSGSAAPAPAATAPGNTVVEQDGKFFVRLGDDRALVGPIKTRAEAESYAASAGKGAPVPAAGWESGPFADRLNNVETSSFFAKSAPSVLSRSFVKSEYAAAVQAGNPPAHGEYSTVRESNVSSTQTRSAVKADFLQAQKAGTLPPMGDRG